MNAAATLAVPPRDAYVVVSLVHQIAKKHASAARRTAYTDDPNGMIQRPFPVPVEITSGFGPSVVTGCGYCSTFQEGLDFTPGFGVAVQAIADGVVSKIEFDRGGLGNDVTIGHIVTGQRVQNVYSQLITVTDEVGQVGNSVISTVVQLHSEIHLNNTPVDPFAWLKANAN